MKQAIILYSEFRIFYYNSNLYLIDDINWMVYRLFPASNLKKDSRGEWTKEKRL